MPKVKKDMKVLIQKWIESVNGTNFIAIGTNGTSINCIVCNKNVQCKKKWQFRQHINTVYHKNNLQRLSTLSQSIRSENVASTSYRNDFYMDLMQAMVAVNLPMRILDNTIWRNFLLKYTRQTIPYESTFFNYYLDDCYNLAIQNIRNEIGENYVWISVVETTNRLGHVITNFVVGKMCEFEVSKPHLLCCKELEEINDATMARFINSALHILFPNGNEDKVLLFVSNATPYIVKAANTLKFFYANMVYIPCLVDSLHTAAVKVPSHFTLPNKLVSTVKQIFVEAPLRTEAYRKKMGNTPLPPTTNSTKWGTWIEAVIFYTENFDQIKEVVESLNETGITAIDYAKHLFRSTKVAEQVTRVKNHLQLLPSTIKKLEANNLSLTDSMKIFTDFLSQVHNVPDIYGKQIREKIDELLKNNPGISKIIEIANILSGNTNTQSIECFVPQQCRCKYKYAPITTCNVERAFPAYKSILYDNREDLSSSSMEKLLVIYCNADCENRPGAHER